VIIERKTKDYQELIEKIGKKVLIWQHLSRKAKLEMFQMNQNLELRLVYKKWKVGFWIYDTNLKKFYLSTNAISKSFNNFYKKYLNNGRLV
jgi:putative heme degradation protein